MKYRKVSESEVLSILCRVALDVMNIIDVISARAIASALGTSKYQVEKHLRSLKEKGLAEVCYVPLYSEDELIPPYKGHAITPKAVNTKEYAGERERAEKLFEKHFRN